MSFATEKSRIEAILGATIGDDYPSGIFAKAITSKEILDAYREKEGYVDQGFMLRSTKTGMNWEITMMDFPTVHDLLASTKTSVGHDCTVSSYSYEFSDGTDHYTTSWYGLEVYIPTGTDWNFVKGIINVLQHLGLIEKFDETEQE